MWWLQGAYVIFGVGLAASLSVRDQEVPTVTIRQGTIRGIKLYTEVRPSVNAFLGIPYAQPPLGNLRFAAPEFHKGWSPQPLLATAFGPACPQPVGELEPTYGTSVPQDEDCLTLNVWTTDVTMNYRNAPVVIFFEGEGFVTGYTGRFPAQDLAAEGVVVVSANYRLNVFGFLCLEDEDARGNLGLLDQYLVLIWVRENIAEFGGDPRSVTLMGHSAGAASIAYHMVSPRTAGLFQRVILMSGSVVSPWSKSQSPSNGSLAIARSLGCLASSKPSLILACLRAKSTAEVLKAFETQYMNGNWTELPLPVVDSFLPEIEQYLPTDPTEALSTGKFLQLPILTGITSHDGVVSISQWSDLVQQGYSQLRHLMLTTVLPGIMAKYNLTGLYSSQQISTLLQWQYVDSAPEGDVHSLLLNLVQLFTDVQFRIPHIQQLHFLSNHTSDPLSVVYAYQFEQPAYGLYKNNISTTGSSHGAELVYLFGPTLVQRLGRSRFSISEERLSLVMKRLWTEFIRKGSITASPYGYGVAWRRYTASEDNFIVLRTDPGSVSSGSVVRNPASNSAKETEAKYSIRLWTELIPNLRNLKEDVSNVTQFDPKGLQLTTDAPYRNAMYALIGFVIILLALLVVCVILLKRHINIGRDRDMF